MWPAPCPRRWRAQGADVAVVLPLYQKVKEKFGDQLHFECYDYVDLAWRHSYCGLFSMERDGVTWYFLDNEQYFRRPELYGYYGRRRAVRLLLPGRGADAAPPEVLAGGHPLQRLADRPGAHLSEGRRRAGGAVPRASGPCSTIHNIEYQGRYGHRDPGGPVRPGPRLGR